MADTYYAWTNFVGIEDENNPKSVVTYAPGDEVTQSDLGVSDEEWDSLVENRAVRTVPYPDMGSFTGSPVEWAKAQLAAMQGGEDYFTSQHGTLVVTRPDGETTAESVDPGVNQGSGTKVETGTGPGPDAAPAKPLGS